MKLYTHKVTVKPVGHFTVGFPIDMLRHDGLVPLSQIDSSRIHRCCEGVVSEFCQRVPIELWKRDVETWKPTEARWKSFLWKIVGHEVR